MGRLAGKVGIVTGAGRGIGHAIATRFGAEGAVVAAAGPRAPQGGSGATGKMPGMSTKPGRRCTRSVQRRRAG